ncbi:hypothetical protein GCM10011321_07020 [Youhaiella tibetensis]|nr:hypothetical protein GCM10011321_07020 [Youhaiella tibetensis]
MPHDARAAGKFGQLRRFKRAAKPPVPGLATDAEHRNAGIMDILTTDLETPFAIPAPYKPRNGKAIDPNAARAWPSAKNNPGAGAGVRKDCLEAHPQRSRASKVPAKGVFADHEISRAISRAGNVGWRAAARP